MPDQTDDRAGDLEVYERPDGKHGWRLKAPNGEIIAGDMGQGYESKAFAEVMAIRVVGGHYSKSL